MPKIERAYTLIASIGADTPEALYGELMHLATQIIRGDLTQGCSGSPSGGSIYSYKHRPEQTHDKYFADIEEWLEAERASNGAAA